MAKDIRVLLYYLYTPIENAEQFAADHLAFCKSIGLKGRIPESLTRELTEQFQVTTKQLKNTWTTFTASQAWKTSGLRLTKKVNKPSRRCSFATKRNCPPWFGRQRL